MSVHLTRIYTRSGDAGATALTTGERVPKNHPRLEAYGTLDELNSYTGRLAVLCAASDMPDKVKSVVSELEVIQSTLFNLGTLMATPAGQGWPGMPVLDLTDVEGLEKRIDSFNEELPALSSFVLPGGNLASAEAHVCRTVCRRLERLMVALPSQEVPVETVWLSYVNRLSDYYFVLSRWLCHACGVPEVLWVPRRAEESPS